MHYTEVCLFELYYRVCVASWVEIGTILLFPLYWVENPTMQTMDIDDDMSPNKPSVTFSANFQWWKRPSGVAAVCLGLLCVLLLAGIIGLSVYYGVIDHHYSTERDQQTSYSLLTKEGDLQPTSYNNLTKERDELQTSYNTLTKERDELQTSYNTMTEERDQLQNSLTTRTAEREKLQNSLNSRTKERDQLQNSLNTRTAERDQLQNILNTRTTERDQLQTSYNTLTKKRDQLQNSLTTKTKEKDQLQNSLTTITRERDQLQNSLTMRTKDRDQQQNSLKVMTADRDQLKNSLNSRTKERDQLQNNLNTRTTEKNQLQNSLTTKTKEKDQLQNTLTTITRERDQLQNNLNTTTTERDQLQNSLNTTTTERDQFKTRLRFYEKPCLDGWWRFGTSCYYVSSTMNTAGGGQRECRTMGGESVIINSREEQIFIHGFKKNVWIGTYKKDRIWQWVDDTPFKPTYWMEGEPNNLNDEVACVEISQTASDPLKSWKDGPCIPKHWRPELCGVYRSSGPGEWNWGLVGSNCGLHLYLYGVHNQSNKILFH
uniref:C-type lectin domain-containing protein n=1 Tax=Oncorhynchus kisutch TaxID=8019 RepID=A0A8C7J2U7_ONCKI